MICSVFPSKKVFSGVIILRSKGVIIFLHKFLQISTCGTKLPHTFTIYYNPTLVKYFSLNVLLLLFTFCDLSALFNSLVDSSHEQKSRFRQVVMLALNYLLEASDSFLDRHIFALHTCELLSNRERL